VITAGKPIAAGLGDALPARGKVLVNSQVAIQVISRAPGESDYVGIARQQNGRRAMFTGITTCAGSLVTGIVVLTGAAILHGGVAAADPQDDQFLALLSQKGIPALQGVPHLIATAHRICRNLDGGASASGLVDSMRNHAYDTDASDARQYPPDRLTRTFTRFVTAAVEAYCPGDQGKIASIMANRVPVSNESTYRSVEYTHSGSDLRQTASLIAEIPPPNPPQIPPPPPPAAEKLIAPQPVAAPPPPKQPPPPPQQPPPPPKQLPPPPQQPPATPLRQAPPPPRQVMPPGPQPGGGAGGSGNGGAGISGGGPAGVGGGDDGPGVVKVAP